MSGTFSANPFRPEKVPDPFFRGQKRFLTPLFVPACKKEQAAEHPELIERAKVIFAEAHSPSQWYRNPGESDESFRAKHQRAAKQGSLQPSTRANSDGK